MPEIDNRARELALERFVGERFNCAESVLLGVTEARGMSCECIPRMATGFGGGMGGCGETCGALVGAIMALGLRFGRSEGGDVDSKTRTGSKVRDLVFAFREEFGSLLCIDLTGVDMTTPDGAQKAIDLRLHDEFCPKFVEFAAVKAVELLNRG